MSGVFVTGTSTEVGKTVVAGLIARTAADGGAKVSVFKPAVSGLDELEPGVAPDHEHLRTASGSTQSDDEISPYRFGPPVSPHLAAELAGETISPAAITSGLEAARAAGDFLVCEGVGGFLVPLCDDYLVRDVAVAAGLPIVVVATPGLGTINHTLLTLEAVRAAGLRVAAVVVNLWPPVPGAMEESNLETVGRVGGVRTVTLAAVDLNRPDSWPALAI